MQLHDIHNLWSEDSKIDETRLDHESLIIPQLHSKYFKIFSEERLRLWKLQTELKQLKLDKQIFLTEGSNEEYVSRGWKLPPRGNIIRQDIQMYLDADKDLIDIGYKIAHQNEKIELLESIIDNLNRRSFTIKNAIAFMQWTQGG